MAMVSLALVAYVIWSSDWGKVLDIAQHVEWPWLVVFAFTSPALVAVSVWKWRCLLLVRGVDQSFASLFGLYVVGQFYNNVLPTSSGGDVVRGEVLRRRGVDGNTAYGSIVVERFTGLAVLIALAVLAVVESPSIWSRVPLMVAVLSGLFFAMAVMLVVVSRRITRLLDRWFGKISLARKALAKVYTFQQSLWQYAQHRRQMWVALGLSVLFYVLAIAGTVLAAEVFDRHVSWWPVSICVPLVLIVTLLPISLNGVGLWEATFAETFEATGMTRELGLSVALLLRARDLMWSVLGYAVLSVMGVARPTVVTVQA